MIYQMIKPNGKNAIHAVAFLRNIECTMEEFILILNWIEGEIGPGVDIHDGDAYRTSRWCYSSTSWNIWFVNMDDGLMFKLRWC